MTFRKSTKDHTSYKRKSRRQRGKIIWQKCQDKLKLNQSTSSSTDSRSQLPPEENNYQKGNTVNFISNQHLLDLDNSSYAGDLLENSGEQTFDTSNNHDKDNEVFTSTPIIHQSFSMVNDYSFDDETASLSSLNSVRTSKIPFEIIRGSISQNDLKFGQSAGKQCTAMAISAILLNVFKPVETWLSDDIDRILDIGNNLYNTSIADRDNARSSLNHMNSEDDDYLSSSEVNRNVQMTDSLSFKFKIVCAYDGHLTVDNGEPYLPLGQRLDVLNGKDVSAVLTTNSQSIAIISQNGLYFIFDSHSRSEIGYSCSDGQSCVCCFRTLPEVFEAIDINLSKPHKPNDHNNNTYHMSIIEIDNDDNIEQMECSQDSQPWSEYVSERNSPTPSASSMPPNSDSELNNCNESIPLLVPSDQVFPHCPSDLDSSDDETTNPKTQYPRKSATIPVDRNTKVMLNNAYVSDTLNQEFYEHRLASRNENCKALNCVAYYIGPIMNGLQSTLMYECSACGFVIKIQSEPADPDILESNLGIVLGCYASGIGFYQLESLLLSADLPCLQAHEYAKLKTKMGIHITKTAVKSTKKAACKARNLAIQTGRVTEKGVPWTCVVADGSWGKRAFHTTRFDSASGFAVVIDNYTKQVVDFGIANQRCSSCAYGLKEYHPCWRNYDSSKSSSSMEASILLSLFQMSYEKYNLLYKKLILDGDSSTPKALKDHNVYAEQDETVDLCLCSNHLLRNLGNKLVTLSKIAQLNGLTHLQNALATAGAKASKAIRAAAQHWKSTDLSHPEQVENMRHDLENIPYHVLGQHTNCAEHYCQLAGDDETPKNYVTELMKLNLWNMVIGCFSTCIAVPADLLLNESNNLAECLNSVIASKNFHKGVNSYGSGEYAVRACFAVIQFNSKTAICDVHKVMGKKVSERLKRMQENRKSLNEKYMQRYHEKGRNRHSRQSFPRNDCHYGPGANIVVLTSEQLQEKLAKHKEKLTAHQNNRTNLERSTIGQADSTDWHQLRRILLTASNFKLASSCRLLKTKNEAVYKILYSPNFNTTPAMTYGKRNEKAALAELTKFLNISIEKSGLFIDQTRLGFGATPDGLIDTDGIVEIKCPYTIREMKVVDAVKNYVPWCKVHFKKNEPNKLLTNSPWYYQIQGQLHITQRKYCWLSIWTLKGGHHLKIEYDNEFCTKKMFPKLENFYWNHLVPELLNPQLLFTLKAATNEPENIVQEQDIIHEESDNKLLNFFGTKEYSKRNSYLPIGRLKLSVQSDSTTTTDDTFSQNVDGNDGDSDTNLDTDDFLGDLDDVNSQIYFADFEPESVLADQIESDDENEFFENDVYFYEENGEIFMEHQKTPR